jgi:hypothetical protein
MLTLTAALPNLSSCKSLEYYAITRGALLEERDISWLSR